LDKCEDYNVCLLIVEIQVQHLQQQSLLTNGCCSQASQPAFSLFSFFLQKQQPVMPLQVGVPFDCPLCAVELFSGSPGSSLTSIASVKFGDVRGSLHGPGAIDSPGVQVKLFNGFFEFKLGRRVT
jgi:hypothetical protein